MSSRKRSSRRHCKSVQHKSVKQKALKLPEIEEERQGMSPQTMLSARTGSVRKMFESKDKERYTEQLTPLS